MITLSELPSWLKEWPEEGRRANLDLVRSKIGTFRASFKTMTYQELCYVLAQEFIRRQRPRRWMVEQVLGRLNTLRNKNYMDSVVHLRTYVFRSA